MKVWTAEVPWLVTLRATKGGEVTQGQNQGRNFRVRQDLAQPSQVVQGEAATLNTTTGLHQPGLRSQGLPGRLRWGQILPAKGKSTSYGNIGRPCISVLSVRNAAGQICGWEQKCRPFGKKKGGQPKR